MQLWSQPFPLINIILLFTCFMLFFSSSHYVLWIQKMQQGTFHNKDKANWFLPSKSTAPQNTRANTEQTEKGRNRTWKREDFSQLWGRILHIDDIWSEMNIGLRRWQRGQQTAANDLLSWIGVGKSLLATKAVSKRLSSFNRLSMWVWENSTLFICVWRAVRGEKGKISM